MPTSSEDTLEVLQMQQDVKNKHFDDLKHEEQTSRVPSMVQKTEASGQFENAPTQCTEDLMVETWNLYKASFCLHSTLTDTEEDHCKRNTGIHLELDDTDLPLDQQEKQDYNLKYVEEAELGLHYKDENTKEKMSAPDSEHGNDADSFPLDVSVYLKFPRRSFWSYQNSQVYMLHATSAHSPANRATKEREGSGTESQTAEFQKSELMRLSTFSNFPDNIAVYPSRLAKSGFRYLPEQAVLECCFCSLRLPPGEFVGVLPDLLHKKKSPHCERVREVVLGNEPSTRENNIHSSSSQRDLPVTYQADMNTSTIQQNRDAASNRLPATNPESRAGHPSAAPPQPSRNSMPAGRVPSSRGPATVTAPAQTSSASKAGTKTDAPKEKKRLTYSDLGIFAEKPKRPEMAVDQKRIASFQDKWKPEYTQTPKMLAEAGMYYAGYGDCARCFFCGGGLKNWEPLDCPWIEHARWFPKCNYLRMCKGQMFVDIVQRKNREKQEITLTEVEDEIRANTAGSSSIEPTLPGIQASDPSSEGTFGTDAGYIPGEEVPDLEILEHENEELKSDIMCKICMDKESAVVFLPCGHLVSCTYCSHALQQCPLCRADIKGSVRAIMG